MQIRTADQRGGGSTVLKPGRDALKLLTDMHTFAHRRAETRGFRIYRNFAILRCQQRDRGVTRVGDGEMGG